MIISWLVLGSSFRSGHGTHQIPFVRTRIWARFPTTLPSRKVSDESLGWDETSFVRLATKLSQENMSTIWNVVVWPITCSRLSIEKAGGGRPEVNTIRVKDLLGWRYRPFQNNNHFQLIYQFWLTRWHLTECGVLDCLIFLRMVFIPPFSCCCWKRV